MNTFELETNQRKHKQPVVHIDNDEDNNVGRRKYTESKTKKTKKD